MDNHFYIAKNDNGELVLKGKFRFEFVFYVQNEVKAYLNDKMFKNDFKHLVPTFKKALIMMDKGIVGELCEYE